MARNIPGRSTESHSLPGTQTLVIGATIHFAGHSKVTQAMERGPIGG